MLETENSLHKAELEKLTAEEPMTENDVSTKLAKLETSVTKLTQLAKLQNTEITELKILTVACLSLV